MADHYPGRLKLFFRAGPVSDTIEIQTPRGKEVVAWPGFDRSGLWSRARMKANARRLVACWNACKGIPTEQLEKTAPDTNWFRGVVERAEKAERELAEAKMRRRGNENPYDLGSGRKGFRG